MEELQLHDSYNVAFPDGSPLPGSGLSGRVRLRRRYLLPVREDIACQVMRYPDPYLNPRAIFNFEEIRKIIEDCIGSWLEDVSESLLGAKNDEVEHCLYSIENYRTALSWLRNDDVPDADGLSAVLGIQGVNRLVLLAADYAWIDSRTVTEDIVGHSVHGLYQGEVEATSPASKRYYKGYYVDGLKHGSGYESDEHGCVYEGEYYKGYRCGRGTLKSGNRSFDGYFINGRRCALDLDNFNPPSFWIGFNDELGKIIFVPRDGLNGIGRKKLLAAVPDDWSLVEASLDKLGTPYKLYKGADKEGDLDRLEKQVEKWKEEYKTFGYVVVLSKLFPSYIAEDFLMDDYLNESDFLRGRLAERDNFSKMTSEDKNSFLLDMLWSSIDILTY